jgi:segregation and condensation protein B
VEEHMTEEQKTENRRQKTEVTFLTSDFRVPASDQEVQNVLDDEELQDMQDDESQMLDEEQAEIETEMPSTHAPTVESVVEAVLFASDESLTDARLASIVETSTKQIRQNIKKLNDKYKANNNAFRIEQIAGGYQMLTLSPYNHWLKKLLRVRSDTKLSHAAMETLAIIAYKQPVMRADIEAIRGVAVGEVIRSLSYKGLVKIVGRAEVLGRPMLYGTTKKFLEVFGLNTLKDLPKVQELREPSS